MNGSEDFEPWKRESSPWFIQGANGRSRGDYSYEYGVNIGENLKRVMGAGIISMEEVMAAVFQIGMLQSQLGGLDYHLVLSSPSFHLYLEALSETNWDTSRNLYLDDRMPGKREYYDEEDKFTLDIGTSIDKFQGNLHSEEAYRTLVQWHEK